MAIKLAIVGLDPVQQEWLEAVAKLRQAGEIELVGVGHRAMAAARDVAEFFEDGAPPAYDDLRRLMQECAAGDFAGSAGECDAGISGGVF